MVVGSVCERWTSCALVERSLSSHAVGGRFPPTLRSLTQLAAQVVHKLTGTVVISYASGGAAAGVKHRGVISASEVAPDLGERFACQLTREVHSKLARPCNASSAPGREQLLSRDPEVLTHDELDVCDRTVPRCGRAGALRVERVEYLASELRRQRSSG